MELDGLPLTIMLPPAVALNSDLLSPKSNQHIYEFKYMCGQHWMKFSSLVFGIWCSQDFRDAQTHRIIHGRRQTRIQNGSGTVLTNEVAH